MNGVELQSATAKDYGQFYDLESYLLKKVRKEFQDQGYLHSFDFFCIIIWKANRAKSKIADGLLKKGFETLDAAVETLTTGLAKQGNDEERLRFLVKDWGFSVSMASAILTVLYPEEFTVYDWRVCETLDDFHNLKYLTSFDSVWCRYQEFLGAVKHVAPDGLTLREKDRYLWGRSFHDQLVEDIKNGFKNAKKV